MKHKLMLQFCVCALITCQALGQDSPFLVPFNLVGNTIVLEASINGTPGGFILDTGSPCLVLNSRYFDGIHVPWMKQALVDFHGSRTKAKHLAVKELKIQDLIIGDELALVADLSQLEITKGTQIHGIIGHSVLQSLETLIDFEKQHVIFFPLNNKGARCSRLSNYQLADSLDMRMSGHFPYLFAEFNGKKLRLAVDTGAEANVLWTKLLKDKMEGIEVIQTMEISGIKRQRKICPQGLISGIRVGHWEVGTQEMIITSMAELNQNLAVDLDGILGAPFLKSRKLAINYKRKKIYLWEDATVVEANAAEYKKLAADKSN